MQNLNAYFPQIACHWCHSSWGGEESSLLLFFETFLLVISLLFWSFLINSFTTYLLPSTPHRFWSFFCWYQLRFLSLFFTLSKQHVCWGIVSYHTHNLLNATYSSFLARSLLHFCFSLMVYFNPCCSLWHFWPPDL